MRQWCWWAVWLLWVLSLVACPAGLLVVSLVYPDVPSYPPPWPPDQPPQFWAERLWTTHIVLSLIAAVAVPALIRPWLWRLAAWVGIAVWLGVIALATLAVVMGKTGMYF